MSESTRCAEARVAPLYPGLRGTANPRSRQLRSITAEEFDRLVPVGLPTNVIDLTGGRYGQLDVVRYAGRIASSSSWYARCDCGAVVALRADRLRRNHYQSCGCEFLRPTSDDPEQTFAALMLRVVMDEVSGCWLWQGNRNRFNYGRLWVVENGKPALRYTHRVMYEINVGKIEAGMTIDHLCRNPPCCNPEHLEQVTLAVNTQRAGAAVEVCKHGHPYTEENTYYTKKPGNGRRSCRQCHRDKERARQRRLKEQRHASR